MEVYLLAQIYLGSNPMADVSPQGLARAAACYTQCLSGKELLGAAVFLLCGFTGGGGGGGVGPTVLWIYWEDTHANDNPPPNPAFSYMRRFRDGDNPVIWDPSIAAWV